MEQRSLRKEKMTNIRMTLKCNPTFRATTDHVEKKIERKPWEKMTSHTSSFSGNVDFIALFFFFLIVCRGKGEKLHGLASIYSAPMLFLLA